MKDNIMENLGKCMDQAILDTSEDEQYIFHGGCYGCTQQKINRVKFCMGCQYFDADWNLPDLNNRPPSRAEKKRAQLKKKYA